MCKSDGYAGLTRPVNPIEVLSQARSKYMRVEETRFDGLAEIRSSNCFSKAPCEKEFSIFASNGPVVRGASILTE